MFFGKKGNDADRPENVKRRSSRASALQVHVDRLVQMARLHAYELKQTMSALNSWILKRQSGEVNWSGYTHELLMRGHRVRNMRQTSLFLLGGLCLYAILGTMEINSISNLFNLVWTLALGVLILWIIWRITLRLAREYAHDIQMISDEGAIEDTYHPRVIFGYWIPGLKRSWKDHLRKVTRWSK